MWGTLVANFGINAGGETSCPNEPMQIMVAQFATDASGSFWWPNLQSVQVAPPGGRYGWSYEPLMYKYEMTCAPVQKNLSEGLSEGGEEDFWYDMFEKINISYTIFYISDSEIFSFYLYRLSLESMNKRWLKWAESISASVVPLAMFCSWVDLLDDDCPLAGLLASLLNSGM